MFYLYKYWRTQKQDEALEGIYIKLGSSGYNEIFIALLPDKKYNINVHVQNNLDQTALKIADRKYYISFIETIESYVNSFVKKNLTIKNYKDIFDIIFTRELNG